MNIKFVMSIHATCDQCGKCKLFKTEMEYVESDWVDKILTTNGIRSVICFCPGCVPKIADKNK